MQAVILAGGLGTRLRPITDTRPKALVPLLNRPMVLHVLDALPKAVDEVVIAASYMIEALEAFFAARTGPPKVTIVEETEPLGTGGALRNLEETVRGTFLALNVDVISSLDLERLVAFQREKGGIGTLALWDVPHPEAYGIVGLREDGRVHRFLEKPTADQVFSRWVNAGAYVFEEEILDLIPVGRPVSLEMEVFPLALDRGLYGMPFDGYWADAGTLTHYLEATRILMDRRSEEGRGGEPEVKARVFPPVAVGDATVVNGGRLGPHVSLGNRCFLDVVRVVRSVLLDDVVVGGGASIEDSFIGANASIGPRARVRDSIVGDGAALEAGSKKIGERVSA